ncbi:hypothetical protein BC835DRAFT_1296586, partial [Cytidiella melzeri]
WDYWPDGDFTQVFSLTEYASTNRLAEHWSNRNTGISVKTLQNQFGQGSTTSRSCLGVITCDNDSCKVVIRPQTHTNRIPSQLVECQCGELLRHRKCTVKARIHKFTSGVYYEHRGVHDHPKPARLLHLTPPEQDKLHDLISSNPKSGPLALLVGVPTLYGPGQSAAEISSVLANQDRLKAERRAVKTGQSSGGDRFVAEFSQFCKEHPDLTIRPHLHVATVITIQSEFMASQLIKDTLVINPSDPVEGIVSDAAHGFWQERNHLLIVSSVYSPLLHCWVPGIMSFSNGASAEHYQHHFHTLFERMADQARKRSITLEFHHFSGVVDFSEAQRLGFIEAFVDFWSTTSGHTHSTREELRKAAQKLLRGCREHFRANVTRISRIDAVVPHDSATAFKSQTNALLEAPDSKTFLELASALLKSFPKVAPWLSWWLKEEHASMLFTSQRKMSEFIWDLIPETTNAEEAMHWKLYSAVGRNHTLLEGLQALSKVADYYQRLVSNVLVGNPIRYGRPEPWKATKKTIGRTKPSREPGRQKLFKNDGRPPDTLRELVQQRKKIQKTRAYTQSGTPNVQPMHKHIKKIKIVVKKPGLPVIMRDFDDFASRFISLPSTSPLQALLQHFLHHQQHMQLQDLDGEPLTAWLANEHLIQLGPADASGDLVRSYFQHSYVQMRTCSGLPNTNSADPQVCPDRHYQIEPAIRTYFFAKLGAELHQEFSGDLAAYLSTHLPIDRIPPSPRGAACWRSLAGQDTCGGVSHMKRFYLTMPILLNVKLDTDERLPHWSLPATVCPWQSVQTLSNDPKKPGPPLSDLSDITYDLVARIFGSGEGGHFVVRLLSDSGTVLFYDDLNNGGRVQEIQGSTSKTHLAGLDKDLMPSPWSSHYALYHLRGGLKAQQRILEHQSALLQSYQLAVSQSHPGAAPHVDLMPDSLFEEMPFKDWWWIEDRSCSTSRKREFIFKGATPAPRTSLDTQNPLGADHPFPSHQLHNSQSSSLSSPPPSPMPMDCRCGTKGDGNIASLSNGLPVIQCSQCERWSHIACQRNGAASSITALQQWLCYICDIRGTLMLRCVLLMLLQSLNSLLDYLLLSSPGKGALACYREFYYPVRLLAKIVPPEKQGIVRWRVRWWRHSIFPSDATLPPPGDSQIAESNIVDELWNDRDKRREIRLGRWLHAHEILKDEELLYNTHQYPYTDEINNILSPHVDLLQRILLQGFQSFPDLPACRYSIDAAKSNQQNFEAERRGMVPFYGGLDIAEQGQIVNWIVSHIPEAEGTREKWQGSAMNAHAATLVIAYRRRFDIQDDPTYPKHLDGAELEVYSLKRAWEYQRNDEEDRFQVDVDHECLTLFEERLFERSREAGIAGWYQWGLDAGEHQESWDPYAGLPSHWNHGDFYPDNEDEVLKVSIALFITFSAYLYLL